MDGRKYYTSAENNEIVFSPLYIVFSHSSALNGCSETKALDIQDFSFVNVQRQPLGTVDMWKSVEVFCCCTFTASSRVRVEHVSAGKKKVPSYWFVRARASLSCSPRVNKTVKLLSEIKHYMLTVQSYSHP